MTIPICTLIALRPLKLHARVQHQLGSSLKIWTQPPYCQSTTLSAKVYATGKQIAQSDGQAAGILLPLVKTVELVMEGPISGY